MSVISSDLTISLADLDHHDLPLAGGKGANLGAMLRAGLPVPPGFCITADAYCTFVAAAAPAIAAQIAAFDVDDHVALEATSRAIRAEVEALPLPSAIADAIGAAYTELATSMGTEAPPVAVRSSATAEDLPDASFAGQQETFLNVRGVEALLDAVKRCWSSLWTPRAIAYRQRNGYSHDEVALAVVIQAMIDAQVSGVLFTADPITGNRKHTVINGSWGLGEAIVSGAVSPDGWVLDQDGTILQEEIARKEHMIVYDQHGGTREQPVPIELQQRKCLTDAQLKRLVVLGQLAARHFGAPQDIEWALRDDQIFLLQSRPITTLFPLPTPRPDDDDFHVYLSVNALQGVIEPFTPMGRAIFRELAGLFQAVTGAPIVPPGKPGLLAEAAGRLYLDATSVLRNPIGRRLIQFPFRMVDPTTASAFPVLLEDPRLQLHPASRLKTFKVILRLLRKAWRLPMRLARALLWPEAARRHAGVVVAEHVSKLEDLSQRRMSLGERVLMVRVLIRAGLPVIGANLPPLVAAGILAWLLTERLVQRWGLDLRKVTALRQGLPGNPTTEMDLALWRISQEIKRDPQGQRLFAEETPEIVAAAYSAGRLPPTAQAALAGFLERYGHRGVREIDVGVPRWSETPAYIISTIRNYLLLDDPSLAPDVHFEALASEAALAQEELITAARRQRAGWVKAAMLRFLTSRMRALMGVREMPKFWMVRMLSILRRVLLGAGEELAQRGLLQRADDVFFLSFDELSRVAQGEDQDLAVCVAKRRTAYTRELERHQLPRILTSEGEVITGRWPSSDPNTLAGIGVSPGTREGPVRVIRNPHGAYLAPGEILVAPSTDPAWTPLFLTAGGLIMEAGGMLSHGSVVAREYGIPAVVGVAGATTRLRTGQRVRLDGTVGVVNLIEPP